MNPNYDTRHVCQSKTGEQCEAAGCITVVVYGDHTADMPGHDMGCTSTCLIQQLRATGADEETLEALLVERRAQYARAWQNMDDEGKMDILVGIINLTGATPEGAACAIRCILNGVRCRHPEVRDHAEEGETVLLVDDSIRCIQEVRMAQYAGPIEGAAS